MNDWTSKELELRRKNEELDKKQASFAASTRKNSLDRNQTDTPTKLSLVCTDTTIVHNEDFHDSTFAMQKASPTRIPRAISAPRTKDANGELLDKFKESVSNILKYLFFIL